MAIFDQRRIAAGGSVLATALVLVTTPAGATVTVADGGISIGTNSSAYAQAVVSSGFYDSENSGPPDVDVSSVPAVPLTVTSSTAASESTGGQTAATTAENTTSFTFASAASARLGFTGSSSASASGDDGYAYGASGYYAFYNFVSDSTATFNVQYHLSGPDLNCCGSRIELFDQTAGSDVINHGLFDTDFDGTISAGLTPGDKYLLSIDVGEYVFSNAATVRGAGTQTITHDDTFDIDITSATAAVPEPATWAMMIGGIGAAGGALRRGRKVRANIRYA